MINGNSLGRAAAGLLALAGTTCCATAPEITGARCLRWRLVIEPRATVSVSPGSEAKPTVSVTARPACAKRETVS